MASQALYKINKSKVDRIIFYNPTSKWGIFNVENNLKDDDNFRSPTITVSGNFEGLYEKCIVNLSGYVHNHPKYGIQLALEDIEIVHDMDSEEGIVDFLTKSVIKGIHIQNARKIYRKFKEDSINTVLNSPDRLSEINGIGQKTIKKVKDSVAIYFQMKEVINFGIKYGIKYQQIYKLYQVLKDDTIRILTQEPYKVLDYSDSFSFKQIDTIALKLGVSPENDVRLEYGVLWLLNNLVSLTSSTGCLLNKLSKEFSNTLGVQNLATLQYTLQSLVQKNRIIVESGVVYDKKYYDYEKYIAEKVLTMVSKPLVKGVFKKRIIEEEINSFPFKLSDEQIHAIKKCLIHDFSVLTSSAGCVDGDTEYFNGKAWVPIRDYKQGDKVLQYSETGYAELVQPSSFIKEPANLWHIRNTIGSIDQVLSDSHRFIYKTETGIIKEKLFGEVRKKIQEQGGFRAYLINTFKCHGINIDLTPERLRLLVAISADGSLYNSGNFWRVRIIKQRKIERLRKLIQDVGLEVDERIFADGYHNFVIPVEYGCKEFPKEFYFLPEHLRQVFCEEIFFWDGSLKCGSRNVERYFTTIKNNADIVQFLLSQLGTRVSIRVDDRVGQQYSKTNYVYKSVSYEVSRTKTKQVSLAHRKDRPPYSITRYETDDKYQYCFTVPSGMLILRRNNNIFVTGNCGKSTITKALVNIYKRHKFNVILLSPTGKATRRLEECTGYSAQTIHKFLGVQYTIEDAQPVYIPQNSVIIIDESSMLDIQLFAKLLQSCNDSTKIILVGDNNQLPSVQAGNILGDLIESNVVNVCKLSKVMRQKEESTILDYCNRVNTGLPIVECNTKDLFYKQYDNLNTMHNDIIKAYKYETKQHQSSRNIQVLTVYKRGVLGDINLNKELRDAVNIVDENELVFGYALNDKVMHIKNNYQKDIFNGEVGQVIAKDEDEILVDYGNKLIRYVSEDIDELQLSYSCTVHKAQGSEYPVVFVIISNEVSNFLLIRKILYTAISRGKEKVYIFGQRGTVQQCISNDYYEERFTKLKKFLIEYPRNITF